MALFLRCFCRRWLNTALEVGIVMLVMLAFLTQRFLLSKAAWQFSQTSNNRHLKSLADFEQETKVLKPALPAVGSRGGTVVRVMQRLNTDFDDDDEDMDSSEINKGPLPIKDQLVCVIAEMRLFFNELEYTRTDLLSEGKPWGPWQQALQMIRPSWPNYFDLLEAHPNIHTMFVNGTMENMGSCIEQSFYYAYLLSGNCTEMANPRITRDQKYNGKTIYGIRCTNRPNVSKKAIKLQEADLEVGLPLQFRKYDEEKVWTYGHVIQSALVTPDGDVISGGIKIALPNCGTSNANNIVSVTDDPESVELYDEVLSIAIPEQSIYNLNIHSLGRLVPYLPFLKFHSRIKIHLSSTRPTFLSLLYSQGIGVERFVQGAVRARLLYLPAGIPCNRPSFFGTHLLQLLLTPPPSTLSEPQDILIFIRNTPNIEVSKLPVFSKQQTEILQSLEEQAKRLHWKVWTFQESLYTPLEEVVFMFSKARLVVAPHGGGQSHLVFSRPGTLLIEGLCTSNTSQVSLVSRNLMHVLGHTYHAILPMNRGCDSIGAGLVKAALLQHFPLPK